MNGWSGALGWKLACSRTESKSAEITKHFLTGWGEAALTNMPARELPTTRHPPGKKSKQNIIVGHANRGWQSFLFAFLIPSQKLNRRSFMIYQTLFRCFCPRETGETNTNRTYLRHISITNFEWLLSDFLKNWKLKRNDISHLAHRCIQSAFASDWRLFGTYNSRDPTHAAA